MKAGDLLHLLGQNDDNTTSTWYAELVGIDEDHNLEVYLLEQTKMLQGFVWSYNDEWQVVPAASVLKVFTPTKGTYVKTYKEFGFIPTNTANQFLKVGDTIPPNLLTPIPLDSDNEEGTEHVEATSNEMDDFIVDDDVANEPFTHAVADNDFVREVHQAVNDYNEWEPKNKQEEKVKSFIDNLAHKYQQQDDDRQFARGTSLDYANPPLNPK